MSNQASRLRDIVEKIADQRINKLRPEVRVGTVFSFDRSSQVAKILFPGNDVDNLVDVRFGLDRIPTVAMESTYEELGLDADGDVVRVAGTPGALFILDYVTGAPQSQFVNDVKAYSKILWKRESYVVTGPGDKYFDLNKLPIENSETLYWNTMFQDSSNWSRKDKILRVKDDSGVLADGDLIEFCYAYQDVEFEQEFTYDSIPFLGFTEWHSGAVTNKNNLPTPAASIEGDLLMVAVSAGANPQIHDRRLVNEIRWGTQQAIYWGYQDSAGGPLEDIDLEGMGCSLVCAAYRGVRVDSYAINDSAPEYSYEYAPNPPMYGSVGLCVVQTRNGFSSAGSTVNHGEQGWELDCQVADYKEKNTIWSWVSKEGDKDAPIGQWKSDVSSKGTIRIAIFKLRVM